MGLDVLVSGHHLLAGRLLGRRPESGGGIALELGFEDLLLPFAVHRDDSEINVEVIADLPDFLAPAEPTVGASVLHIVAHPEFAGGPVGFGPRRDADLGWRLDPGRQFLRRLGVGPRSPLPGLVGRLVPTDSAVPDDHILHGDRVATLSLGGTGVTAIWLLRQLNGLDLVLALFLNGVLQPLFDFGVCRAGSSVGTANDIRNPHQRQAAQGRSAHVQTPSIGWAKKPAGIFSRLHDAVIRSLWPPTSCPAASPGRRLAPIFRLVGPRPRPPVRATALVFPCRSL